jgi:hypothetical protein
MGTRLERIARGKLLEQLARPGIELFGQYHLDRNVVIASPTAMERRHTLATQTKPPPILCASRQGHRGLAINRWDIDFCTQENLGERDWHITQDIASLACKIRMGSHPYDNV